MHYTVIQFVVPKSTTFQVIKQKPTQGIQTENMAILMSYVFRVESQESLIPSNGVSWSIHGVYKQLCLCSPAGIVKSQVCSTVFSSSMGLTHQFLQFVEHVRQCNY